MNGTTCCQGWDIRDVARALRMLLGTKKFRLLHGVSLGDFYVRGTDGRYVWVYTRTRYILLAVTHNGGGFSDIRIADPAELEPQPPVEDPVCILGTDVG